MAISSATEGGGGAVASADGGGGMKRKRTGKKNLPAAATMATESRWRTEKEHRIYSAKLLDALRRVRETGSPVVRPRGRAVRDAADRALAVAARGRTRWSRAILSSGGIRLKTRMPRVPSVRRRWRMRSTAEAEEKGSAPAAAVERKARVLGRLVPGCRQLQLPKLLEETADYIAALEMQVGAMAALAVALSSASPPANDSSP